MNAKIVSSGLVLIVLTVCSACAAADDADPPESPKRYRGFVVRSLDREILVEAAEKWISITCAT